MKLLGRILAFNALTWVALIAIGGSSQALGFPPELGLPQWGPGLAGLAMLALFRGDDYAARWWPEGFTWRRWLGALALPVTIGALATGLARVSGIAWRVELIDNWALALAWAPLGALGEELGWRGYLQGRLDTKLGPVQAALLTGLCWTPIHLHFFAEGPLFVALLALVLMSASVVMRGLVDQSGAYPVALAALVHLGINLANFLGLGYLHSLVYMGAIAGLWVALALYFVLSGRTRSPSSA